MDARVRISQFSGQLRVLLFGMVFILVALFAASLFVDNMVLVAFPLDGGFSLDLNMAGGDISPGKSEQLLKEAGLSGMFFEPENGWVLPLANGILLALFVGALFQLERLFFLYQSGVFFAVQNASRISKLGMILIGISISEVVLSIFVEWMCFQNISIPAELEPFTPEITFSFDIKIFLIGLFLILIARVMQEASELEQEVSHLI